MSSFSKSIPDRSNLTEERPTFVDYLECSATGAHYPPDQVHGLSEVGKPLLVRYSLDRIKEQLSPEELALRPSDLWKFRELLPVRSHHNIVSMGETTTPLLPLSQSLPKSVRSNSPGEVLVKDEGRLPTGSFKARGITMAVSMAKELGLSRLAMPTNGNAGAAMAAYATAAGMETFVFCPADTPEINVAEIAQAGAQVFRVDGLIDRCGQLVGEGKEKMGWFDVSTLKEPYRIEGKKTMGLELAEQLGWELPDIIFYPTGGGTGLIGMWKAFGELVELGWVEPDQLPQMVAVQAEGCAPIVTAFERGTEHAKRVENAHTIAAGIRVPQAIGDFLILNAVRQSGGYAMSVTDTEILTAQSTLGRLEGLLVCPEGAATFAAYQKSLDSGQISGEERAVLFNCGSGLKYPMPTVGGSVISDIDWDHFPAS